MYFEISATKVLAILLTVVDYVSQHITLDLSTLCDHGFIIGDLPFLYKRNKFYFAKWHFGPYMKCVVSESKPGR